jgi:hypothetical protein
MLEDSFTTCRGAHPQGHLEQLRFFIEFADPRCMLPAPVSHYAFRPERDLRSPIFSATMRAGATALHALDRVFPLASRLAAPGRLRLRRRRRRGLRDFLHGFACRKFRQLLG